jgi:hypothetical protein
VRERDDREPLRASSAAVEPACSHPGAGPSLKAGAVRPTTIRMAERH